MNFTVCPFCSCGCQIYPRKSAADKLIGLVPPRNHPISMGSLCIRGWNSHEYMTHPDRLSTPLLNKNGKQFESSWEEAIEKASVGLQKVIEKWGPESIGIIGSTRCSNEDNYLLMKLARDVVMTGNIDTSSRLTYFPVLEAFYENLGTGTSTATLDKVSDADFILVVGADPSGSCPQGASRLFEALNRNAKLAVVDPRITKLTKLAHYHLQLYPGTDLYWINGMISHLIREEKIDADFINLKTIGYNEFIKDLDNFSLSLTEDMTGIPAELLKTVSEHLAEAKKAIIIIGTGLSNAGDIKRYIHGLINLGLVTGHVGKSGSGFLIVGGNNNTQGAWDMGVVPDRLPGGVPISKGTVDFNSRFGLKAEPLVGKGYSEIIEGVLSGEIRALYVMGEDLLAFCDSKRLPAAISKLELLVVQDLFPTELTRLASVVFPASAPFERAGTFTNLERRVQRFEPIIEQLGNTKADWEILADVSRAMGVDFSFKVVFDIMDEIASVVPPYKGTSSANLRKELNGITCPKKEGGEPGEQWLQKKLKGKFVTALPKEGDKIETSEEYPLLLIPGRLPSFWGTGTRSSRVRFLAREEIRSAIHINPEDAKKYNVKGGCRAHILSPSWTLETSVVIDEELPKGLAYLPLHKIDGNLQRLSKRSLPIRVESG